MIDGGVPLSGTIAPAGNKNAALPILAACVLTQDEVVLHNVPQIRDVEAMLELLEGMGVRIERREDHTIALCAAGVGEDALVDKGAAGIFYRLQAGPLADKAAAKKLCTSLKAKGQDCIVASK